MSEIHDKTALATFLREHCEPFGPLTQEEALQLMNTEGVEVFELKPGQFLFQVGDDADALYALRLGILEIEIEGVMNQTMGDVVGGFGAFYDSTVPRTATVTGHALVVKIPFTALDPFRAKLAKGFEQQRMKMLIENTQRLAWAMAEVAKLREQLAT